MIENLYVMLKGLNKDVFLNIRSITEVPANTEEFFSLYIENEDIQSVNDVETTYGILYGRKKNRAVEAVQDITDLYTETGKIADFLLQNLPTSTANITYGSNDMYNFALIRIPIKHRRKR